MPFSLSKKEKHVNCFASFWTNGENISENEMQGWRKYKVDVLYSSILLFLETIEENKKLKETDEEQASKITYIAFVSLLDEESQKTFIENFTDFQQIMNFVLEYINGKKVEVKQPKTDEEFKKIKINEIYEKYKTIIENGSNETTFDLFNDSKYIYPSFLQDYNIDLIEASENRTMTYQRFQVLLAGLSDKTRLKTVMNIRSMEIPKGADEEQKEKINKAKETFGVSGKEKLDLYQKQKLEAQMLEEIKEVQNG